MEKFDDAYKATQELMESIMQDPDYASDALIFEQEYEIAEALVGARRKANVSQSELAERMKTTQSVISRMESGKTNVSISKLQQYAASCGGKLNVKITF